MSQPTLRDYEAPIGRLTMAAAYLEETIIRWISLFSDEGDHLTKHSQILLRGLDKNMDELKLVISEKISPGRQSKILDLIENSRKLKNSRNESVHGVWMQMVCADTGEPVKVQRSRYNRDKITKKIEWDIGTPTIQEIDEITKKINEIVSQIDDVMYTAWSMDEKVVSWRISKGYA